MTTIQDELLVDAASQGGTPLAVIPESLFAQVSGWLSNVSMVDDRWEV